MKKLILIIGFLITVLSQNIKAQYKTVIFDEEQHYFNQGEPLPSDQYFIINGYANPDIEVISVTIKKWTANISTDPVLYKNYWKRSKTNNNPVFELPVNYALFGNNKYDIILNYYSRIDSAKAANIVERVNSQVKQYVDKNLTISKNKLKLQQPYQDFLNGLENIVANSCTNLHNKVEFDFAGFSTELKDNLKKLNPSKRTEAQTKAQLENLKKLIDRDIAKYVNLDFVELQYSHAVKRYSVEKTANIVAANIGYGATFATQFDSFKESSKTFIGISLPLSSRQYSPPFIKNTAISLGISLQNYKNSSGNTVTGPIIKRPIYVAWGYKIFRIVRLNAGMQLLSTIEDGIADPIGNIQISPFFGVSAELDVWVGVGKRKNLTKR